MDDDQHAFAVLLQFAVDNIKLSSGSWQGKKKHVVYVMIIPVKWIARDSATVDRRGETEDCAGRAVVDSITVEGLLLVHI